MKLGSVECPDLRGSPYNVKLVCVIGDHQDRFFIPVQSLELEQVSRAFPTLGTEAEAVSPVSLNRSCPPRGTLALAR
jgi:hypothetical protein